MKKIANTGFLAVIAGIAIISFHGPAYVRGNAGSDTRNQTAVSEQGSKEENSSKDKVRKNCWIKKKGKHYRIGKDGNIIKEKGRIKLQGTWYYLNRDGSRAYGFKKDNGKIYYFIPKKGNQSLRTGFRKIHGNTYYFKKDHTAAAGYSKCGKKYYLFSKKGVLLNTDRKIDGTQYYINEKSQVEAYRTGSVYYWPDGSAMSKLEAYDYDTYQTARSIAAEITNDKMSKAAKLKTVFTWVMKKSYITKRAFTTRPGWIPLYANDHFHGKGSTCQGDAAAFAYLAKAVGYKDVYVCMDSPNPGGHAWTEIAGKAYDPLFAQNRGFYKHYAIEYGNVFRLRPRVHIKMS